MPSQRELTRARDRISSLLAVATEPGASYASQKAALTGVRRELIKVGGKRAAAEDLVDISSRTYGDPDFRAAYLLNAVLRMRQSEKPHTQTVLDELNNYRKHVRADGQRLFGLQRLRAATNAYGPVVGWYSVLDDRTTEECRYMHGRNFDPREPPEAGLPGITHVNCRCRPGPPHAEVEASTEQNLGLLPVTSRPKHLVYQEGAVELSDLNWSPKKNWVEKKGGLPPYVVRIAKRLIAKGFSREHAIATAINVVKKMKGSGDLNWPGRQRVNAGSRAQASGAVARWEAMKASDTREGKTLNMASPNKQKGRSYGTGGHSIPGLVYVRSTASPKHQKPGAAPGTIPSTDPKTSRPRGNSIEPTKHGAVPRGGTPKKVPVLNSSAAGYGKGPSDATKISVKRVREVMAHGRGPNTRQVARLGSNTDAGVKMKRAVGYGGTGVPSAGGQTPRKKSVGPDSWKGSGHASPARVSLAMQKYGVPPKTSNTERAKRIMKKIRKWGKPKKRKLIKSFKPTSIA